MRKTVTVQRRVGPGFLSLLTLLFVGLKLTGVVDWSWWWVLSPLWLPAAIILAFVALVFVLMLIGGV